MLYIRADGNAEIGMGHVMRCLSIAEAAAEKPPVFITADEESRALIEDRGFGVIVLNTDYRDMMSELPQLEQIFCKKSAGLQNFPHMACQDFAGCSLEGGQDVLLVDSYQVCAEYFLALREFVPVACLEDMGVPYPVDLLINYNIYAPELEKNYKAPVSDVKMAGKYPKKVLSGAKYMPLRKAFQEPAAYTVCDKVTDVIITTGGSDPYFALGTLTDALCSDKIIAEHELHFHLISGPFNRFAGKLRQKYLHDMVQESGQDQKAPEVGQNQTAQESSQDQKAPESGQNYKEPENGQDQKPQEGGGQKTSQTQVTVTIHENVKDMRGLLLKSDVVITATGSTIYEVSALGIPMIVFYFAENQRQGAEAIEKRTDIVNAGCFAEQGALVADRVSETLKRCICDKSYRALLSRQEKRLIDGKGARRIAEQLFGLAQGEKSNCIIDSRENKSL